MHRLLAVIALAPLASAQVIAPEQGRTPGVAYGGPIHHPSNDHSDCITPTERALGRMALEAYRRLNPPAPTDDRPVFPFVPMGGTLHQDLLPPGYVDNDPTAGIIDYFCSNFTYNGHAGTDIGMHSFEEQVIGVPVFAPLPGVVVYSHDGEPDMSTCLCGQPANALIIDHGNGRSGWYWHFKRNTVAFQVGQQVREGDVLGYAASSGNSAGPHLHLGVEDDPGNLTTDPFAGACGPTQSGWTSQPPMVLSTYIADFGYSTQYLGSLQGYPFRFPNTGQFAFDEFLWFWAQVINLPPHSTWRQKYIRPNGTLAFDSGAVLFESNQTQFYRGSNWWWYHYFVDGMRSIPGTWRIQLLINEQVAIDAPLEIRATRDPNLNRPPSPITSAFDPLTPEAGKALFCRVASASLAVDDLDYDLVRFEYVWQRNGIEVRRNTLAGRADALPAALIQPGDTISCSVRAGDGRVWNAPVVISTQVPGGCPADLNGDGVADFNDYLEFLNLYNINDLRVDFNSDGIVDFNDYLEFLNLYNTGC